MDYQSIVVEPVKTGSEEKRCYTVSELQKILKCGKATVYDLLKKNEFRYIKLGGSGYRISKPSFDAWLDGMEQE